MKKSKVERQPAGARRAEMRKAAREYTHVYDRPHGSDDLRLVEQRLSHTAMLWAEAVAAARPVVRRPQKQPSKESK